jgi:elongation factor P--(R)-beta-lysine ligase
LGTVSQFGDFGQARKVAGRYSCFFFALDILEVDVPVLGLTSVSDVHINSLKLTDPHSFFLQSSPEYYMKRLLASGAGAIYYLGKAFRGDEFGPEHYPEFTMLEWYRPEWDEHRLMVEVLDLLRQLGLVDAACALTKYTYGELFLQQIGVDVHTTRLSVLQQLAGDVANNDFSNVARSTCIDLIFSHIVEPKLPEGLVCIYDYPACQAGLAKIQDIGEGVMVARRFEIYYSRMELGNGYYELTDGAQQRDRFEADNVQRLATGKCPAKIDEKLLAALDAGLVPCSGVALGVDRLLMSLLGIKNIRQVIPFADLSTV